MLNKIQTNYKRYLYRLRHDYLSMNNIVIGAALLIALSWTWNSMGAMQQNYELQQQINNKNQQLKIEELKVATLELESKYYESLEYQELAVRERLGKGMPGEKLLIVPSTDKPRAATKETADTNSVKTSNLQEWINFLFGGRHKDLQD